jgi:cytochrome oxidase assembly protein ShyY1
LAALSNKKREAVDALLTQLGDYKVEVYLCPDEDGREDGILIPESEHGHFFQGSVYTIDIKGSKHRYLIQWFGPRMPSD